MSEMARDYVIRKRGYFYRPEAHGYCGDVRDAGRWTYEDAIAYQKGVEGVTVHHLREFPEPLPTTDFDRDTLIKAIRSIKQATIDGRVCDDVAWFDEITTLHDFCDQVLAAVGGARE